MTICMLVAEFPVLSQTFIFAQIRGIIERGHRVLIVAGSRVENAADHDVVRRFGLLERTRFQPPLGGRHRRAIDVGWRLCNGYGLRLIHAWRPLTRGYRVNTVVRALYRGLSLLDVNPRDIDVVHAHFANNGLLAVLLRDLGLIDCPVLTSFHGFDVTRGDPARRARFLRPLFQSGDCFTHPSDYIGAAAAQLGCPPSRQVKHGSGIDLSAFQASAPLRERQDGPLRVLSVARLAEKKGLAYGIQAVARLHRRGRAIQYQIVGDGPLRAELADLIRREEADRAITLLGWRTNEQVQVLLQQADVFLLPSVTAVTGDREGLPVAILEALAGGMPVVATAHSGIPEAVIDRVTGFLTAERDVDAIADRLEELAERPALRRELGLAGRRHIERNYDLSVLNDRLVGLYAGLDAGRQAVRAHTAEMPAVRPGDSGRQA